MDNWVFEKGCGMVQRLLLTCKSNGLSRFAGIKLIIWKCNTISNMKCSLEIKNINAYFVFRCRCNACCAKVLRQLTKEVKVRYDGGVIRFEGEFILLVIQVQCKGNNSCCWWTLYQDEWWWCHKFMLDRQVIWLWIGLTVQGK